LGYHPIERRTTLVLEVEIYYRVIDEILPDLGMLKCNGNFVEPEMLRPTDTREHQNLQAMSS